MAAKKPSKRKAKAVAEAAIKLHLEVNGGTIESEGDTVDEAIFALPKFQPKTHGKMTYTKDGKTSKPFRLNIRIMNRLTVPGMSGEIARAAFIKRLTLYG